MKPPPSAPEIREAVDRWRQVSWPKLQKEKVFDSFFNGETLPCDGDTEPLPTLGLGRRFVKKPFGHLMSFFDDRPGPLDAMVTYPEDPSRALRIARSLKVEANNLIAERYRSLMRSVAGRYLVTGRAFGYRTSKWDILFRHGRLLCPQDAPDDIASDQFWEWAFVGQMQLAEIDEILEGRRKSEVEGGPNGQGWNRQGLEALKKWIMESPPDRDGSPGASREVSTSLDEPFSPRVARTPLDVYYYFRKSDEKRKGRYRRVNFYIISRYRETAEIRHRLNHYGQTERRLEINIKGGLDDRNQVLFSQEFAFDSVYECLIPFIGDSRISGDQEMLQVKGEGELVFSRLLVMEHLNRSAIEGIGFGMQPNFYFETRADAAWARKIGEEGLGAWDEVPKGFKLVDKNNAFTGLGAGVQVLNMLGFSVTQDGATGDISNGMGQGSDANFKAEAEQLLGMVQQDVSMRNARFYSACDILFGQLSATLFRRPGLWRKNDPGYWEAKEFHECMERLGIQPFEYEPSKAKLTARRVGDKQASLQKAAMIWQNPNASLKTRQWAEKQFIASAYDDATAESLYPEEAETPDLNQAQSALLQNSAALVSLIAPQPNPGDDPAVHLEQYHRPALVQRIQLLVQQGSMTPIDQAGLGALMQHMAQDAQALPADVGQPYLQELQKAAQMIQEKIPVNAKGSEMDMAQREAARKDAESQAKIAQTQSLIQNREQAAAHKEKTSEFDQQLRLAQLADQETKTNLQAAKQQHDAAMEAMAPIEPVLP